ncbi:hypothetical protein ACQ4WP_03400 [Janthinobacterium sp. GB4P2]|uniref:hypothetical protein n=1 Tax=Janthinobacterium sp. GB4P2 TaxID=3424189 RepID=UPI003F2851BE
MAKLNNSTMLPASTSGSGLTHNKEVPVGSLSDESGTLQLTLEGVRLHAADMAAIWNGNEDSPRNTMPLLEWRDSCRDWIRDEILEEIQGCAQDDLLAAWAKTFDGATTGGLLDTIEDVSADIFLAATSIRDLAALVLAECSLEGAYVGKAKTLLYALLRCVEDINELTTWIKREAATQGGAA